MIEKYLFQVRTTLEDVLAFGSSGHIRLRYVHGSLHCAALL
jgi:hypothetical protein